MTPALSQAINLLQLSSDELKEYVNERIYENPFLKFKDDQAPAYSKKDYISPFEFIEAKENKLKNDLMEQTLLLNLTAPQRRILHFLMASLEPTGFLAMDAAEAAEILGAGKWEVEEMIEKLKNLEPGGIGCQDLMDYILFQLNAKKQTRVVAYTKEIVKNNLMEWAAQNYRLIMDKYGVNSEEIEEISQLLLSLKKSPVDGLADETTAFQAPDVKVEFIGNQHILHINDHLLPQIQIDSAYIQELSKEETDSIKSYIREKRSEAEFLIKSLEKRKITLSTVAEAIIEYQKEFFISPANSLKPLRLKDIAQKIKVHESTVSRITRNTCMQTPKGLFSFKFFFQQGMALNGSDETESILKVKQRIKAIIEMENRQHPFSDEKIKELLVREGLQISRRTIAKYRTELGICDSVKRRTAREILHS
ncbi:RNA polymerase factor sigma-54 [Planococcus ruber]|nr:RNA polymerase factor sigma-54 [Planococcus ruber]